MEVESSVKGRGNGDDESPRKKVLYFSDGVLEMNDDDETDVVTGTSALNNQSKSLTANPQDLTWFPWVWHYTVTAGTRALEVCDYVGESLASFFGITTPKYQFEINEYMRIQKAVSKPIRNPINKQLKKEEESQIELEMKRWSNNVSSENSGDVIIQSSPSSV